MRVPARPASASASAAGEVIRASRPVARTNVDGRLDLRPHRAGGELGEQRLGLVRGELGAAPPAGRCRSRRRPPGTSVRITSRSAPSSRASRAEARSLSITASTPARWLAAPRDRDPAAAAGDDDRAGGEQRADRAELDDLERRGEGRRAASRGPRRGRPASRGHARARGPLLAVERADRLRRLGERRVVRRDQHVREQAGDRAAGDRLAARSRSARRSPPGSARPRGRAAAAVPRRPRAPGAAARCRPAGRCRA